MRVVLGMALCAAIMTFPAAAQPQTSGAAGPSGHPALPGGVVLPPAPALPGGVMLPPAPALPHMPNMQPLPYQRPLSLPGFSPKPNGFSNVQPNLVQPRQLEIRQPPLSPALQSAPALPSQAGAQRLSHSPGSMSTDSLPGRMLMDQGLDSGLDGMVALNTVRLSNKTPQSINIEWKEGGWKRESISSMKKLDISCDSLCSSVLIRFHDGVNSKEYLIDRGKTYYIRYNRADNRFIINLN